MVAKSKHLTKEEFYKHIWFGAVIGVVTLFVGLMGYVAYDSYVTIESRVDNAIIFQPDGSQILVIYNKAKYRTCRDGFIELENTENGERIITNLPVVVTLGD